MKRNRFIELIIDPSTNQLSASRLCLMVMVLGYLPIMMLLEAVGIKITYWTQFAAMLGSITGCYAANSAARVWKEYGGVVNKVKPAPLEGGL